ncbi:MAG TPA: Maf family protein [Alphaproteobacteria bacterium]|nr:Maf family protein [Alphaproteobacteria bacterium]
MRVPPRLILASASPRRRELLAATGLTFEILPADLDESPHPGESAETYVRRLALAKAQAIARHHSDAIVLAADTTVTIDGLLLGKPQSPEEARWMLRRLRGREHAVVTGVAVMAPETNHSAMEVISSRVQMRPFAMTTIEWYLASGEPLDKAGAYAIQGLGAALIERVEGSYTNVVGLPLTETLSLLGSFGIVADG